MEDVVKGTHAETRAESERRKQAASEAEMTKFALKEPIVAVEPPKKSSVWFAVLTIVFLIAALLGVGFGVYEYFQNETLKTRYNDLEKTYLELKELYDSSIQNALKSTQNSSSKNSSTQNALDTSDCLEEDGSPKENCSEGSTADSTTTATDSTTK